MPLSKAEKKFVSKLANFNTDEEIMYEINRIRWECGREGRVSTDMVQKERHKQGIKKFGGKKKGIKKGPKGKD